MYRALFANAFDSKVLDPPIGMLGRIAIRAPHVFGAIFPMAESKEECRCRDGADRAVGGMQLVRSGVHQLTWYPSECSDG